MSVKRIKYLDFIRFIAICTILFLHLWGCIIAAYQNRIDELSYTIINTIHELSYFGVPLFFMTSGTLMLNPEKKISTKKWIFRYLLRLVLALFIFGAITEFLNICVANNWNINNILTLPTFVQCFKAVITFYFTGVGGHFWFIYSMIIIYVLLPILRKLIERANIAVYIFVFIFLIVVCPILRVIIKDSLGFNVPFLDLYLFYYIFGYFIFKYCPINKKTLIISLALLLVSGLALCFGNIYSISWLIGESNIPNIVFSISIFVVLRNYKGTCIFFKTFNKYIFGIYLCHPFICGYPFLGVENWAIPYYLAFVVLYAVTFFGSWFMTWLLMLIKPMKKYVL